MEYICSFDNSIVAVLLILFLFSSGMSLQDVAITGTITFYQQDFHITNKTWVI